MLEFYEKFSENLKSATEFTPLIEEVCNPQAKVLSLATFTNSRKVSENHKDEKSHFYPNSGYEIRTSLKSYDKNDKMFLPKNNPLQELETMNLNK